MHARVLQPRATVDIGTIRNRVQCLECTRAQFACSGVGGPPTVAVRSGLRPSRRGGNRRGSSVTVHRKACDLTGVIVRYGPAGVIVPTPGGGSGAEYDASTGATSLDVDVDAKTGDVTIH